MWTQDEDGDAGFRRVLATVSHEEPFLVAVQWSGYPGGAIEATFEHPFYVEGKGWVAAAELAAGDLVVTAEGGWREVEGVEFGVGPAWVHNLTVEEKHTFFVGEEGAWVHNCPTASGGGARTFTSSDPLVGDLANAIEARYPGHVVGVNVPMRNVAGELVTDADILLQNAVIQVKSGGGKGLTSQLSRTATATELPVIGYGPDLGGALVKGINAQGGLVTRDAGVLLDVVAP